MQQACVGRASDVWGSRGDAKHRGGIAGNNDLKSVPDSRQHQTNGRQ